MRIYTKLFSIYLLVAAFCVQTNIMADQPPLSQGEIIPLQLSRERIDSHKQSIEKLVHQRKWGRKAVRVLQAGATVLTIGELLLFMRDLFAAFDGEDISLIKNDKAENKKQNLGILVVRTAVVAVAHTITSFILRRYYERVMQQESISWYIFTQAFYKINCTEIKQRESTLQQSKDDQEKLYHMQSLVTAHNGLIKQLEKIIAFMEYKLEHMPIANRPEARSLTNHFIKSVTAYADTVYQKTKNQLSEQTLLVDLTKLESIIDRELLRFSRLEGDTVFTEQQYSALLRAQAV